jgi:glycylpeptide N-tetradecanoyltransferase
VDVCCRGTILSVRRSRVLPLNAAPLLQHPETHAITDFFSFYTLPSTIVAHPRHSLLQAAYLYYYATDTAFVENADDLGLLKRRLTELIGDAIILADQAKFDVFNALTLMDNLLFLQELKVRRF